MTKTRLSLIISTLGILLIFGSIAHAQARVVHWEHYIEGLAQVAQTLAEQFEAENPDVDIVYEPMPYANYWEKLLVSLESGTGPDVFKLPYGNAREFYLQGLLAPIPESIMTNEEMENTFAKWTIEDFQFDGQYYAMPVDIQVVILNVNNELFEEAGLEIRQPRDWDEVIEWATLLTKRDEQGRLTQVGLDLSSRRAVYKTLMMQYLDPVSVIDPDAMTVNYDTPDGIAAWQFIHDLIHKHKVADPTFLGDQAVFAGGHGAISFGLTSSFADYQLTAPELKYTTLVVPPPAHKSDSALTRAVKYGWFVSSKCKNPELAWKWVMYATSDEAQYLWKETGVSLPSRIAVLEDERWFAEDPNWPAVYESVKIAKSKDTIVGWADINSIRSQLWEVIVHDEMPVEEAVKLYAARENEVLREKKELFDWIEANR